MAITEFDYRVILTQRLLGQDMQNAFWFKKSASSIENAQAIADDFENDILPLMNDTQSQLVTNRNLRVENMLLPTDWVDRALTGTGVLSVTSAAPPWIAVNITFNPEDRTYKPMTKRFGGLVEGDIEGDKLSSATITRWSLFALEFTVARVDVGGDLLGNYQAMKSEKIIDPEDGSVTYVPWSFVDLRDFETPYITTQRSRGLT